MTSSLTPEMQNLLILAFLWSLPWKGIALWKAARKNDNTWFITLLIVNTLGLLEAAYIFHFSDREKSKPRKRKEEKHHS